MATLADLVASRDDWTSDDLIELDRQVSQTDLRSRSLLPLAPELLDPEHSSLEPLADYTQGGTPEQTMLDAFTAAVDQLRGEQGDDVSAWQSVCFDDGRGERGGKDGEVCTASAVLGPCGRHYYIERGAWVHHVGFAAAAADGSGDGASDDAEDGDDLAATGGGAAAIAVLLLLAAAALRRRSVTAT